MVEPGGVSQHREGDRVELVCTAVAVEKHEQPFWYQNGSTTPCTSPDYQLQSWFDESACRWNTILTISEFSEESAGIYHCTVGQHGRNTTLHLDCEWMAV